MTFSVVIVVRNDRAVQDTLEPLQALVRSRKDLEVIVVDASAPDTLKDIKDAFPAITWLYYKNTSGKRFTIPEQRNMGIAQATGDVVIFVDASCVPEARWFAVMRKAFADEKHDAVAGMVVSADGKKSTHDHGYELRKDNAPIGECGAANLAVKRSILTELGGFDTRLSYGEDVDLTWRISDAGYKIIFKKKAVLSHDWGTFREERRRAFRYGQARIVLYKKHPRRWRGLLGIDSIVVIYPLYIMLLPITFWWPFYPLFIIIPLVRNWNKQPFKTTFLHLIYGFGVFKGLLKDV
jgi:GT2 family glycosyltransferase